jgi:hypothetical protein
LVFQVIPSRFATTPPTNVLPLLPPSPTSMILKV